MEQTCTVLKCWRKTRENAQKQGKHANPTQEGRNSNPNLGTVTLSVADEHFNLSCSGDQTAQQSDSAVPRVSPERHSRGRHKGERLQSFSFCSPPRKHMITPHVQPPVQSVQSVISNLLISHIELRSEESPDILAHSHQRSVEKMVVPLGEALAAQQARYLQVCE